MILSPALSLDLDLLIVLAAAVGTGIVARVTRLPITGLEIVAGIALVSLVAFQPSAGLDSLVVFGSLLIVFLAGLETCGPPWPSGCPASSFRSPACWSSSSSASISPSF
jgi:hypothetical protein